MIAVLVYNVGTAILRAVGDSRRPLYFLIVACAINVVLDLLLVKVIPMGIAGASLATVLAQIISALLVIITLVRTKRSLQADPSKDRFDFSDPSTHHLYWISGGRTVFHVPAFQHPLQATLNGFGTDVVAGWTAFNKIDALYWMGSNAFGVSIMTFAGQNFGAGKFDRIRKKQPHLSCHGCRILPLPFGYHGSIRARPADDVQHRCCGYLQRLPDPADECALLYYLYLRGNLLRAPSAVWATR